MYRRLRSNRLALVWGPLFWILPGVLFTACSPEGGAEQAQNQVDDKGERVFEQQCSACHGPQGRGPSIAELRALSPEQLREGIRNHPTAGQLPERLVIDDLGNLIEYLD